MLERPPSLPASRQYPRREFCTVCNELSLHVQYQVIGIPKGYVSRPGVRLDAYGLPLVDEVVKRVIRSQVLCDQCRTPKPSIPPYSRRRHTKV